MKDCAFCRTPCPAPPPDGHADMLAMVQARVKKKDPVAICHLGGKYVHGMLGLQKDAQKAVELWTEAAEALYNLGVVYALGEGVGQDRAKGIQMYEKSAMGGNIGSRHNLGCNELEKGKYDRALKHFLI